MSAASIIALPGALSDQQRSALLKLLTDEDPGVYRAVREKILSEGASGVDWLRSHRLSNDPVLRRHVNDILRQFDTRIADDRFLAFCLVHHQDFDLEQAAWLLAQTEYPDINVEAYQAMLDDYARAIGQRLGPGLAPKETLQRVNQYLFEELGFAGNEENYYEADNSYLNRVIDRRTGNPINLSLLYLVIARRLKLPVTGIGLPGHFICRYQSSAAELYIDIFNRGRLLAKADCIQYLLQGRYTVRDDYLSPVTPRRIFLRVCRNLHQVYLHLDQQSQATRFQRYCVALAK